MDFNNCAVGNRVTRGDPYILATFEDVYETPQTNAFSLTSTRRLTGGLRFESSDGTYGRASYDCSTVMTLQRQDGTVSVSTTSTGTITWEQPLGTVTTSPCGP
jgi:hypothetical protein